MISLCLQDLADDGNELRSISRGQTCVVMTLLTPPAGKAGHI